MKCKYHANQHKDFSVITNIFITYDNILDPLATGTGAATVIITVLGVTSAAGAVSAIGAASPFLSGKYFAQLKQLWKAFKTSKEVSKLSIGGIPLKAKIFSMSELKEFLEQFG